MKKLITLLLLSISLLSHAQYELTELEQQIYIVIKEYKLKHNPYYNKYDFSIIVDKELSRQCKEHSIKMFKTTNVYHDPNRDHQAEIVSRAFYKGYPPPSIYSRDSLHIVIINNFLNSPRHKKVIDSWDTHVGVGTYIDTKNQRSWTTIRFYTDDKLSLELITSNYTE